MNSGDQIEALEAELTKVLERFRMEFDMPYGSIVGVLDLLRLEIGMEALGVEFEDDEGDPLLDPTNES